MEWVEGPRQGEMRMLETLEQESERLVMRDDYGSFPARKSEQTDSPWLEDHEKHGTFIKRKQQR